MLHVGNITYIELKLTVNVGKYSLHGASGMKKATLLETKKSHLRIDAYELQDLPFWIYG